MHTADCLRAEDFPAKETNAGVAELLLRVRAATPVGLLDQTVEVFGQTDKLKDSRVRKAGPQAVIFEADSGARSVPMEDPARDDSVKGAIRLPCRADGCKNLVECRQMESLGKSVKLGRTDIGEARVGEINAMLDMEKNDSLAQERKGIARDKATQGKDNA